MNQCLTYAPTTSPLKHVSTHISPRATHAPGVKKGFIKGEALRLLITNSSKTAFDEKIKHFQSYLAERGYQEGLVQRTLSEVIFENRKQTLQPRPKTNKQTNKILPSITQYHSAVLNFSKQILMKHWYLIEKQPLLKEI